MSRSTLEIALDRIATAPSISQIAVFYVPGDTHLDTKFAATIVTQRQIAKGHPHFVGCYDMSMPPPRVRAELLSLFPTAEAA